MKKFEPIKIYILQNGHTKLFPKPSYVRSDSFVKYYYIANHSVRDKRILLFEINKTGNISLSIKDKYFEITPKQMQQICGLWKNLKKE